MKKNHKIIALCLSFALLVTAIGGTLAWLTDKDQVENVFSVGEVDIQLTEEVAVNNDKQSAKITTENGKTYFNGLMPGDVITKQPIITNDGVNDAYVRVVVTLNNKEELNKAIDVFFEKANYSEEGIQQVFDDVFTNWHLNYSKDKNNGEPTRLWMADEDHKPTDNGVTLLAIDMVAAIYDTQWAISKNNVFQNDVDKGVDADGKTTYGNAWNDKVYYYNVLGGKNGDEWDSRAYIFYLKIKGKEANGDTHSYTLFDGLTVPTYFDSENLAGFDGLKIGVYADAIQTEGFNDGENAATDVTDTAWYKAFTALEKQHALGWWRS